MSESRNRPIGVAFLLAQLGAHAAGRFAARVAELGLSPADVGLLRMIAFQPGRSQQSLAADLGVVPSRVTAMLDPLDRAGLVERRRSAGDRRNHELHLTAEGTRVMEDVKRTAMAHEADLTSCLSPDQRGQLLTLLELVADDQGLTPGVHPGYRRS
ncbi:MarR family winged helix-turn-helix transcriptional regulator [Nonomuraea spiralis]|uniref:MarR family winged helix-turn-helix transcriptional regulator n=1 Tax=Nonomuraea TaxID=83681 RepID=UPI0021AD9E96|nr:MarR family transcriptional regulator [Nonomuraea sp. WAC 01424]